jgi:hypothetical protein
MDPALDALKADLISRWDEPFRRRNVPQGGGRFQALVADLPPRGGFAVGEGRDEAGSPRLEIRVTASAGPDRQRAEALAVYAEQQGVAARILDFLHAPKVGGRPSQNPPLLGGRRQPLHLGASIAHEAGYAGSVGAFVTLEDGSSGALSCAHVLAEAPRFRVRKGDDIQQPGQPDAVLPANSIGTLSQYFTRFTPSRTDNLDAAVALLSDGVTRHGNRLPECEEIPVELRGRKLGAPLTPDQIELASAVLKVGRTTGLTRGVLTAVDLLNFRPQLAGRKPITFGRVHEVASSVPGEPFTKGGDSGSLILTEQGLHPLGIHFCVVPLEDGQDRSYMIPWDRIVETFSIAWEQA